MDDTLNMAEQTEPMNLLESAEVTEETEESASLAEVLAEPEQAGKADQPPATEPGWIKGRINKAVEKALAQERARTEEMLAPIRESILERQAQELVDSGEVKSLAIAKELLTLRNGKPAKATETKEAEPAGRDDKGRFAAKDDAVSAAKARLLVEQAQRIKASKGLDVMEVYNSDPDVKAKVLSGEWDFHDVAESMAERKNVPAPVRSSNAGQVNPSTITGMSAAQFKRLNENLSKGVTYDMRKME